MADDYGYGLWRLVAQNTAVVLVFGFKVHGSP